MIFTYEELEVLSKATLPAEFREGPIRAHWFTAQAKIILELQGITGEPLDGEVVYAVEQTDATKDIVVASENRFWWTEDGDGWLTEKDAKEHSSEKNTKVLGYGTTAEIWPGTHEE